MKSLLLVSLLALVSCGKKLPKIATHFSNGNEYMAEESRPYFNAFVEKAKCLGVPLKYNSLSIKIAKDAIDTLGLCQWRSDGKMTITIDRDLWDTLSVANREKTMFHELGHCALKAEHAPLDKDIYNIMNPILYTDTDVEFMSNHDHRVKELFKTPENTSCHFDYTDLEYEYFGSHGNDMAVRVAPTLSIQPKVLAFGDHHADVESEEESHDHE